MNSNKEKGSGTISVNGAAAHKANPGDIVIIATYGILDERDAKWHKPTVIYVDEKNKIK